MPSNYDYGNFANQQMQSQSSQFQSDVNAAEAGELQQMKSQQQLANAKTGMRIEMANAQIALIDKVSMR